MAQNYTRQSSFNDGDTISASLFNDEYNQLVNSFSYSSSSASGTGHRHDGSAGQGGNIFKIGDLDFLNKIEVDSTNNRWGFYVEVSSAAVEQLRIQDGAVVPVTDNDIDLGISSLEFKNLYLDGTANVDTLIVDETATITGAATLSSTLGVTGATTLSSTLGVTGATTLSSTLAVTGAATLSSTLALTGAATLSDNLTVAGVTALNGNTTIGNAATDTVTITADVASNIIPSADSTYTLGDSSNYWSAGFIDALTTTGNVTVGGNLTVTGNATISGNLTFGDADTDTVSFSADVVSDILPDVTNTYDLGSSSKQWKDLFIDGTANIDSLVADTADINGGTIDGATIGGASAAAGTFTTATATTGNITTVNATTVDTTNIEVTNVKAKDGTASATIADITGVMTIASSVLTTTDINGGTIDGATLGGSSQVTITDADMNGGTIDGVVIGGASAAAGSFTTVTADGLTVESTSPKIFLSETDKTDLNARVRSSNGFFQVQSVDDSDANPVTRFQIEHATGDISFYEDTGTTAKFFWDASAEALGIGTTSPTGITSGITTLAISDAGAKTTGDKTGALSFITNDGSFTGTYSDGVTAEIASISTSSTGAAYALAFSTATTSGSDRAERMRIDHSGHVLTGTTTRHATSSTFSGLTVFPTGISIQKRDGGVVGYYDRLNGDGAIHQFQSDGVAVGSVGSRSGDLWLGTGVCGMRFIDADPSLAPLNLNTIGITDNTINIGRPTGRWKDIYIGGGLYVGGTGSANFLDDYEEGTWTPEIADATSGGNTGSATIDRSDYTKIGRQVTVSTRIRNINTTGMTSSNVIYIRGLPFTSKTNQITIGAVKVSLITFGTSGTRTDVVCQVGPSATWLNFVYQGDGVTEGNVDVSDVTSGTGDFAFTITYFTA